MMPSASFHSHFVGGVVQFAVMCILLGSTVVAQEFQLVPVPKTVAIDRDAEGFQIPQQLNVFVAGSPLLKEHVQNLCIHLQDLTGSEIVNAESLEAADLFIGVDVNIDTTLYEISVTNNRIRVVAKDQKGIFRATATLLQIVGQSADGALPQLEIRDQPDCDYRSLMIDVGRNPHSLEALKETIDLLWFYKMDSLHLHLTDDQLFAFPSKAFPKLQTDQGRITWEEFASLERYAQVRGIVIIPELDVPGHSTILRRAYPDVFGKSAKELAESKMSRQALKTLLDEMIELFPSSPWIHVGGDEAGGVPEESQRDLINELHAHLKSKGKKTLVWEGPRLGAGENKVNQEVIHINWRTINFPADQMVKAGYPVVNAAWDPLYIVDHYPRNNFTMTSPQHIFEKLDLYRFGHFNPGIPTFAKPLVVDRKTNPNIIGFCMPWWEGREENYVPLVVPRLIPMADVAWTTHGTRDHADFVERTKVTEQIRHRCFYPVRIDANPLALEQESVFHNQTTITLECDEMGEVRYTLDGTQPTQDSDLYKSSFPIDTTTIVRAANFVDGKQDGYGTRRTFSHVPAENLGPENFALGKPVTSSVSSGPLHSPARLTDGGTGALEYYLGYPAEPEPIEVTIDLGSSRKVNQVVVHAFTNGSAFEKYALQVSADGVTFETVADRTEKPEKVEQANAHDFPEQMVRFVRVTTNGCKGYVFDSFSKLIEIQVFHHVD